MKSLPPKLFEMSQKGVEEATIQFIFDALLHAEENDKRFVNVYQDGGEPSFLFTNSEHEAEQQLRMWGRARKPALAFVNTGDTWEERASKESRSQ
jgi:hypothetical protein